MTPSFFLLSMAVVNGLGSSWRAVSYGSPFASCSAGSVIQGPYGWHRIASSWVLECVIQIGQVCNTEISQGKKKEGSRPLFVSNQVSPF